MWDVRTVTVYTITVFNISKIQNSKEPPSIESVAYQNLRLIRPFPQCHLPSVAVTFHLIATPMGLAMGIRRRP